MYYFYLHLKMRKLRLIIIAIVIVIISIISRSRIRIGIVSLPHTVVRGKNRVLRCRKAHQDNPYELVGWVDHQGMPLANKKNKWKSWKLCDSQSVVSRPTALASFVSLLEMQSC